MKRSGNIVIINFITKANVTCPNNVTLIEISGVELENQYFTLCGYQSQNFNGTRASLTNNVVSIPANSFTPEGSAYGQVVTFLK